MKIVSAGSVWQSHTQTVALHTWRIWLEPTSKYLFVSVEIAANSIWFNARDLNCRFCQFRVSVEVTVIWNTGKWDSLVLGIFQYINNLVGHLVGRTFCHYYTVTTLYVDLQARHCCHTSTQPRLLLYIQGQETNVDSNSWYFFPCCTGLKIYIRNEYWWKMSG